MNKYLLIVMNLVFVALSAQDQSKSKVFHENDGDQVHIYGFNEEFCPISMRVTYDLENLEVVNPVGGDYVIPSKAKKHKLATLRVVKKGQAWNFKYRYKRSYGDYSKTSYDENYIYDLPYLKSNTFRISQGYNGDFSHKGKNALDFSMPIGTEIAAIREGTVIRVIDNNSKRCGDESCKKYNNYVLIYHNDGTIAEYAHIKFRGSKVKLGDKVSKGQVVALSGNVGFSTRPHLHLQVFKSEFGDRRTLETKFKVGNGEAQVFLTAQKEYLRSY